MISFIIACQCSLVSCGAERESGSFVETASDMIAVDFTGESGTTEWAMPLCDAPIAPACSIENQPVDCSIAFLDVFYQEYASLASARNPYRLCLAICAFYGHIELSGETIFDTDCPHATSISGITCCNCSDLADKSIGYEFCDGNYCTVDSCSANACQHVAPSWLQQACNYTTKDGLTCPGVYVCDQTGCEHSAHCFVDDVKKCIATSDDGQPGCGH